MSIKEGNDNTIKDNQSPENLLAQKAISGDEDAFTQLITLYKKYLYRTAYLYVKNESDALDIFSETVYKGFIGVHKLKNPFYFKTWITRILINNAVDLLRKSQKVYLTDNIEIYDKKSISDIEDHIDLYDAIDNMNTKYKSVIILRYFDDLTIENIAEIMRCPVSTVKSYLRRGKQNLGIILKEGQML